jgi:carbonic anhydrase/acetyltransferase-like protein (isoleucine patch superfamily)
MNAQPSTETSRWANTVRSGPGVVVRADMNAFVLGKYVNIQDNSTLHSDSKRGITIGDYTLVVGHHAMIHGCTIGRGVYSSALAA